MQIQSATSTLQFNFTSETQRQALFSRLTEGQTLQAQVVDQLSDGRWAVRVMGHTLVAESRLALGPGQQVEARVETLGPPLVLSLSGHVRAEDSAMARAFQALGLSDTALNRAIVRGLIAGGHAVSREAVQSLRALISGLQGAVDLNDAEALEAVIARALFLQRQGIPVTGETLRIYLSQLPPGVLGGLFADLSGLLKALRLRNRPEAELAALSEKLSGALPNAGDLTGESLQKLMRELGVDLEGRLAAWLMAERDGLPEDVRDTLRNALLRLQMQLEDMTDRSGQTLLSRVRDALQMLDTLQATNVPTETREALALQIPFVIDDQAHTADLQVYYNKRGDGHFDPDNLRFTLAVDLSALGHVRFDLSVLNKHASLRIFAEDEQRAAFLKGASEALHSALEGCGYAVGEIGCRAESRADEPPTDRPGVGLDFRV